jgi:hypothetical protein
VAAYDPISKRKVSKTFRTLAEARRWRAGAHSQAAKGVRLAGTSQTLVGAAEAFVDGIASGAIRTRAGERYKPSVVREYERSLRLQVLPTLGGAKLSKIQRRDVQRLADDLLASGADPSTSASPHRPRPPHSLVRCAQRIGRCGVARSTQACGVASSEHSSGTTSTSRTV